MTQKRRKADNGKVIGETTALRWEPTHVTKLNPRVVPLHRCWKGAKQPDQRYYLQLHRPLLKGSKAT